MRVLILGANGMLGRALARAFAQEDALIAWDRAELDITEETAVAERLTLLEPDVVLNAAAYTDVEGAERDPEAADTVNGHGVGNLAVTCRNSRIPLLHVSTDYVYSGTAREGYPEDAEPRNPVNAYGRSKLLGESLLRENGERYWLIRTAGLFGPHGRHFVDSILAHRGEEPLRVVSDQIMQITYAVDLAEAIRSCIRQRVPFGTYHLTNAGATQWAKVAEATLALAGRRVRVEHISSDDPWFRATYRAPRPRHAVLLNTKRPALRHWRDALRAYLATLHDVGLDAVHEKQEVTRAP